MACDITRQSIEVEELIGAGEIQAALTAETLVPGAGREAVEPLLSDARFVLDGAAVQTGRVVLSGNVFCQTVYRQGDEVTLRALTAQSPFEEAVDIDEAAVGMTARVQSRIEDVSARYENGHIIFRVTATVNVCVYRLTPVEVIDSITGCGIESSFETITSVKLAAEAESRALLTERVSLPASLDARTSLMDWASIEITGCAPDLGGVRVRGTVYAETLIGTGVPGRPAAVIKYPLTFDQLVELPEWLSAGATPEAEVTRLASKVEQGDAGADAALTLEAEVTVSVKAMVTDEANALSDAYSTSGKRLKLTRRNYTVCTRAAVTHSSTQIRGTVLLSENAPGVGTVLAVRALPESAGITMDGDEASIEGVLTLSVLYMPGGSDRPQATRAELPFTAKCGAAGEECFWNYLTVTAVEANALMSDRLEVRATLDVCCESRETQEIEPVSEVEEAEDLVKKPGIILFWPDETDSVWSIGRRYNLPTDRVIEMNGSGAIEPGRAVILRI